MKTTIAITAISVAMTASIVGGGWQLHRNSSDLSQISHTLDAQNAALKNLQDDAQARSATAAAADKARAEAVAKKAAASIKAKAVANAAATAAAAAKTHAEDQAAARAAADRARKAIKAAEAAKAERARPKVPYVSPEECRIVLAEDSAGDYFDYCTARARR